MARFREVTILHDNDGTEWCQYLADEFKRLCDIEAYSVDLHELVYENPPEIEVSVRESCALILLVTQSLIKYMENNRKWFPAMLESHNKDLTTIFPILLSLDIGAWRTECDLYNYEHLSWYPIEIDPTNYEEIPAILRIIQEIIHDRASFVEKEHQMSLVTDDMRPAIPVSESTSCQLFPSKINMEQDRIAIVFEEEIEGTLSLLLESVDEPVGTTNINPFCVSFVPPPDLLPGVHRVHVLLDGEEIEVLSLTVNSIQFTSLDLMQQCFGVTSVKALDKRLAETYRNSICSDETLQRLVNLAADEQATDSSALYPTALHWAAANGLNELTCELLASPCAIRVCEMTNHNGHTVSDLAQLGGHHELKEYILDFIDTQWCADTCDIYVQGQQGPGNCYTGMPSSTQSQDDGGSYLAMEVKRPVTLEGEQTGSLCFSPYLDAKEYYVEMDQCPLIPPRKPKESDSSAELYDTLPPLPSIPASDCPQLPKRNPPAPRKGPKLAQAAGGCKSQNELIKIQEQVKLGNFDLDQAEMLLNAWKSRYMNKEGNSAASFRDKQASLNAFRNEYKNTMSFLSNTKKGKSAPVNLALISDPILYRKYPERPRDRPRNLVTSNTSSRSSSDSVMTTASRDSGCRLSAELAFDSDSNQTFTDEQTSRNKQTSSSGSLYHRPPAPLPKFHKKTPVVHSKRK